MSAGLDVELAHDPDRPRRGCNRARPRPRPLRPWRQGLHARRRGRRRVVDIGDPLGEGEQVRALSPPGRSESALPRADRRMARARAGRERQHHAGEGAEAEARASATTSASSARAAAGATRHASRTAPRRNAERDGRVRAGPATPTQRRARADRALLEQRRRVPAHAARSGTTSTSTSATRSTRTARCPAALSPIALTVRQKWAKYRTNLGNRNLRALRGSAGFFSHWDDHEFVNDFSPQENTFSNDVNINGRALYRRGVQGLPRLLARALHAARRHLPHACAGAATLELFFLDQRSFRSAKADEGGVCNNPQSGEPDLAPTAPQAPATCSRAGGPGARGSRSRRRASTRSASRTGPTSASASSTASCATIKSSNARFKMVMNELPIQQYYVLPYDRWEGYEAERQQVLRELRNVKNVVFLTTDVHATLVNDARFQTLEPGGPRNSGHHRHHRRARGHRQLRARDRDATVGRGQRRARGLDVLRAAAAGGRRHAVLDHRPVQLRSGARDPKQPDRDPEGHRRPAAEGRRRSRKPAGRSS